MAKRRSTPRDDLKRSSTMDERRIGIIALAVVAVLAAFSIVLPRCSGDGTGVSSEARDVPLVVEP